MLVNSVDCVRKACANALFATLCFSLLLMMGCSEDFKDSPSQSDASDPIDELPDQGQTASEEMPVIDFTNWKVTLPISRPDGKPLEVEPPEILSYETNSTLAPFMYNDYADSAVVFYTYPGSTTANSSFSRTELREQMVPGSNRTNWTFSQGGRMRGTLSVPQVTSGSDGNTHRVMIMQIHGRLTDEQRDLIGEDDNNAPPILKIYWRNNVVYVKTKELRDLNADGETILRTSAWKDDDGRVFSREVGADIFTLEVIATEGKIVVTMDDQETFTYENEHLERWGVFENYFKAGNYLLTTDQGAFSRVKYYNLEISHD